MLQRVKDNIFSIDGWIAAIVIDLIIVGLLSAWMFINVQVLGHDVTMSFPSETAIKERVRK